MQIPIEIEIPTTAARTGTMGMQSFTVYIIKVKDFGREYEVEHRYSDFQGLREALLPIAQELPPLPEKKWMASTDEATVQERRPMLEKLLRGCLQNEAVLFERDQQIFKFLELTPPAMAAGRFLSKGGQLQYLLKMKMLLDPKYEKEHAYRLGHVNLVRTNLRLLAMERLTSEVKDASEATFEASSAATAAGDGASSSPESSFNPPERECEDKTLALHEQREAAALDMLRWAMANGNEASREVFFSENGLGTIFTLFRKIAEREQAKQASSENVESSAISPDQRCRTVLNAVIGGEGEKFSTRFAAFLESGGMTALMSLVELLAQDAFADMFAKLLWMAWEPETQKAFLSSSPGEGLRFLSALFGSSSSTSRLTAGLLISMLVVNGFLEYDQQVKASAGLENLLTDMCASSPMWVEEQAQSAATEPNNSLSAFIQQALGKKDQSLAKLSTSIRAPCDQGVDLSSPLWACASLAAWCILKCKPKAARVADLRPYLPILANCGHQRTSWLAGELLLFLDLYGEERPSAETACQELNAINVSMNDQINFAQEQLQTDVHQCSEEIRNQNFAASSLPRTFCTTKESFVPLEQYLGKLVQTRESIGSVLKQVEGKHQTIEGQVDEFRQAVAQDDQQIGQQMQPLMVDLQGLEATLAEQQGVQAELTAAKEALMAETASCDEAMKAAEQAVVDARQQISNLEKQIDLKQQEARTTRTLLSKDTSTQRQKAQEDIDSAQKKMVALREQRSATPESDGEALLKLKEQAVQLKQVYNQAQAELQALSSNPEEMMQRADALDQEVASVTAQRDGHREEQRQKEQHASACRDAWQTKTSELQGIRNRCNSADDDIKDSQRKVQERWARLQPLQQQWSKLWLERLRRLQRVQQGTSQLGVSVRTSWESLQHERDLRRELLDAAHALQNNLADLIRQIHETPA